MSAPSTDELCALYIDQQLSTRAIGALYGVAHITVRRWLTRYGIPVRPTGSGLVHRGKPVPSGAELERMIYVDRLTYKQVAQRYGADKTAVPYWLDRHGIPRPSRTRIQLAEVRLRYEQGESAAVIADALGCSKTTILKFLARMNVSRRPTGWRAPYRAADGTTVRSTYEVRVADWLTGHDISYTYEPRVPFGHGNTRADFLANGWYIEVWGIQQSQSYSRRRAEKVCAYRTADLPLIELAYHHFSTRDRHILEQRLHQCLTPPVG